MSGTWASGWATGDIVTAPEFGKGVGSVSDQTLSVATASISFASLPTSYAHLMILIYARGDAAAASVGALLRFNGDTAANYDYERQASNAASTAAAETFAASGIGLTDFPANTAGANLFGGCVIFVPHYANASNNKMAIVLGGYKSGTTTGTIQIIKNYGQWRSNAAVTQITVLPSSGNFVAGTRVTAYAMGA